MERAQEKLSLKNNAHPSAETRIGLLETEHVHSVVEEEYHIKKIREIESKRQNLIEISDEYSRLFC